MRVLITGGTGSLGKMLVKYLLNLGEGEEIRHVQDSDIERVTILSRDELKQFEMHQMFPGEGRLVTVIGDVRDLDRLMSVFPGNDVVIHAAALKQVPVCEYYPEEAIRTNILGTLNVCKAASRCNVQRVITLSTDKAANPVNLYGATKLAAEKITVQANQWGSTRYAVCRYGNVFASRGSVVPMFADLASRGESIPITDIMMTRFWITLPEAAQFVWHSIHRMRGGEIFVPKLPSVHITDLAEAVCEHCKTHIIGIRPGEKLHEILITCDEVVRTTEFPEYFRISPSFDVGVTWIDGQPVPQDFVYTSDTNKKWLSVEQLRKVIEEEYEHQTLYKV